VVIPSANMTSR